MEGTDNTCLSGVKDLKSYVRLLFPPHTCPVNFCPTHTRPKTREKGEGRKDGVGRRRVSQSLALTAKRATIAAITLSRREIEPNLLGFLITALVANRSILSFFSVCVEWSEGVSEREEGAEECDERV